MSSDLNDINAVAQQIARILVFLRGKSPAPVPAAPTPAVQEPHRNEDPRLDEILAELKMIRAMLAGGRVEPRLFTMAQAGVYIGRTAKAVEHLIAGNAFATIRYGGRVHIDKADLDGWIEKNRF